MTGPSAGSAPPIVRTTALTTIFPELLDTATVEADRSHQRTGAIEPSPGPVPNNGPADLAPGRDERRRAGRSADAGGGPDQ